MEFTEAVNRRRSVRKYDPNQPIDAEKVKQCIELSTLAPNSSNMQLWEFYHICSKDKLQKLSELLFRSKRGKYGTANGGHGGEERPCGGSRVKSHVSYLTDLSMEKSP